MGGAKKIIKNPKRLTAAVLTGGGSELLHGGSKALTGQGIFSPTKGLSSYGSQLQPFAHPEFESMRDEAGGLKSQFQVDPSKSAAFQKLQEQAMAAPGESAWAKMQLQKQGLEEAGAREGALRSGQQALAQAQGQLLRTGGLSSGARTRMAMQGARDLSRAQQDVARQGMLSRLGIGEQDIGRQEGLLRSVGETELGAQRSNLGSLMGDVEAKRAFDLEKYKTQMGAFGAEKTAQAQERAASRSGKK